MAASKFTPENRAVILAQLRTGGSLAGACREIGVRLKTAEGWLTRGRRENDGDYADFAQAVDEARAAHERAGMTPDEFEGHLAKAVRAGSVQAMKLWAELHLKPGGKDDDEAAKPADPFDLNGPAANVTPIRRGG
jgi:transposase-like protein